MPAARAKQRFVTALVQKDEPVEQRRCSEALSGGPGRGARPKRKPDAGGRQCNADKDESGAAGVLRPKMPELSWNRWPFGSFVPMMALHTATIRVRRSGSRERPLKKDEEG